MLGKIGNVFGKPGEDGKSGKGRARGLGWRIGQNADYNIDLPPLSGEEEELVLEVEGAFREAAGKELIEQGNVERELSEALARQAEAGRITLDSEQRAYLAKYARMHIYGFAFLDDLVNDDSIEEISIIGIRKPAYVFVRKAGWKKVNAYFDDEKVLMDVINKMARGVGRRITLQNPRLDAMLPGGSRLHASLPPISAGELTIRKFRQNPFSPRELAELGTAGWKMMAFISMLMQTDSSVMIAGNTASGKTSTLNALFSFVDKGERVLVSEETPEISIPHEHQVRLVANRDMGLALKDLVYDSLRMRPDRMIVGEVRNKEEVEALFDVLLVGALVVPLILGVSLNVIGEVSTFLGGANTDILEAAPGAVAAYVVIYSALSSAYMADAEGRGSRATVYFAAMAFFGMASLYILSAHIG